MDSDASKPDIANETPALLPSATRAAERAKNAATRREKRVRKSLRKLEKRRERERRRQERRSRKSAGASTPARGSSRKALRALRAKEKTLRSELDRVILDIPRRQEIQAELAAISAAMRELADNAPNTDTPPVPEATASSIDTADKGPQSEDARPARRNKRSRRESSEPTDTQDIPLPPVKLTPWGVPVKTVSTPTVVADQGSDLESETAAPDADLSVSPSPGIEHVEAVEHLDETTAITPVVDSESDVSDSPSDQVDTDVPPTAQTSQVKAPAADTLEPRDVSGLNVPVLDANLDASEILEREATARAERLAAEMDLLATRRQLDLEKRRVEAEREKSAEVEASLAASQAKVEEVERRSSLLRSRAEREARKLNGDNDPSPSSREARRQEKIQAKETARLERERLAAERLAAKEARRQSRAEAQESARREREQVQEEKRSRRQQAIAERQSTDEPEDLVVSSNDSTATRKDAPSSREARRQENIQAKETARLERERLAAERLAAKEARRQEKIQAKETARLERERLAAERLAAKEKARIEGEEQARSLEASRREEADRAAAERERLKAELTAERERRRRLRDQMFEAVDLPPEKILTPLPEDVSSSTAAEEQSAPDQAPTDAGSGLADPAAPEAPLVGDLGEDAQEAVLSNVSAPSDTQANPASRSEQADDGLDGTISEVEADDAANEILADPSVTPASDAELAVDDSDTPLKISRTDRRREKIQAKEAAKEARRQAKLEARSAAVAAKEAKRQEKLARSQKSADDKSTIEQERARARQEREQERLTLQQTRDAARAAAIETKRLRREELIQAKATELERKSQARATAKAEKATPVLDTAPAEETAPPPQGWADRRQARREQIEQERLAAKEARRALIEERVARHMQQEGEAAPRTKDQSKRKAPLPESSPVINEDVIVETLVDLLVDDVPQHVRLALAEWLGTLNVDTLSRVTALDVQRAASILFDTTTAETDTAQDLASLADLIREQPPVQVTFASTVTSLPGVEGAQEDEQFEEETTSATSTVESTSRLRRSKKRAEGKISRNQIKMERSRSKLARKESMQDERNRRREEKEQEKVRRAMARAAGLSTAEKVAQRRLARQTSAALKAEFREREQARIRELKEAERAIKDASKEEVRQTKEEQKSRKAAAKSQSRSLREEKRALEQTEKKLDKSDKSEGRASIRKREREEKRLERRERSERKAAEREATKVKKSKQSADAAQRKDEIKRESEKIRSSGDNSKQELKSLKRMERESAKLDRLQARSRRRSERADLRAQKEAEAARKREEARRQVEERAERSRERMLQRESAKISKRASKVDRLVSDAPRSPDLPMGVPRYDWNVETGVLGAVAVGNDIDPEAFDLPEGLPARN